MRAAAFALLLAIPCSARAQQSAPSARFASIVGAAVDSVRGGYLKGAIMAVSGTARSAVTDSMGRFRIDSIPPGTRHVEVMHPLLDSLALAVRTPPRELKAGDTTVLIVGIPSAATIVATKCSAADRARGAAALVGFVVDADTDAPAAGATVTVRWMDYQLGNKSINRTPQTRTAVAAADGSYRVCGVPDDLTTGATAHRGTDTTGTVPANFVLKLAVASFRIPSSSQARAASPVTATVATTPRPRPIGRAVLRGKVVDANGAPVPTARVALDADESVTTTNAAGEFTLSGLRAGTREITVRRIGFEAIERAVEVDSRNPGNVTLQLNKFVPVLETVRISALRDLGLQRVGFAQRQKSGAGKYIGPVEIERRNPLRLNYLLEGITSLRTGVNANGQRYVTGRFGDCVTYFVDGRRWFSGGGGVEAGPDYWLSASELGAVEVYTAGFAPGEFMGFGSDGRPCTSVVIWTKWKLRI